MKRGKRREARGEKKNMRKRITLWLLATLFLANVSLADAQQPGKIFRIGYLENSTASGSAVLVDAFRQEMTKLGWIEGKNIAIEYRCSELKAERLPELAADLVRLNVDLIVTTGEPPALAAKRATTNIPIVMANAADPVGSGFVASLARPGGNVTGLSNLSSKISGKRLEMLMEAVSRLSRVAIIWNPDVRGALLDYKETEGAARSLG